MVGKEEEGTGSSPVPLSIHISQSSVTCNNALEIKPLNCNSSKIRKYVSLQTSSKIYLVKKNNAKTVKSSCIEPE